MTTWDLTLLLSFWVDPVIFSAVPLIMSTQEIRALTIKGHRTVLAKLQASRVGRDDGFEPTSPLHYNPRVTKDFTRNPV
jgi:hypothetical protein